MITYFKNFSPRSEFASVLAKKDHALWVILQQFVLRGLVGIKFILLGRLLGPEAIGLVGVALLAIAIAESLSDTGLPQAIVQRQAISNAEQLGAIWTLLLLRGLLIGSVLLVGAPFIANLLRVPSSTPLIAMAAALPLLRNALGPGYYLAQRERNFRSIAILEMTATAIDFGVALLLVVYGFGPIAVVIGSVTAELIRMSGAWLFLSVPIRPNFQWRFIRDYVSYGKWIWGSSVLSLILNQFDKILVTRLLGATEFGLYQMAYKLAQLTIADAAVALSQYLFPTFADKHRLSPDAARSYFRRILMMVAIGAALLAMCLSVVAPFLVAILLGPDWIKIVPLLRVLVLTMTFGAVIAVLVVYARAIGRPELVTQASGLQLALMLVLAPVAILRYGTIGMAWALVACVAVTALWILNGLQKAK